MRTYARQLKTLGEQFVLVDLKDFGSTFALSRQVFDSQLFLEWKLGTGRLYLLLDSYDEGLLAIDALSGFLVQELKKLSFVQHFGKASASKSAVNAGTDDYRELSIPAGTAAIEPHQEIPLDRLYLCIASRPAVWPMSLTTDLREIVGKDNVETFRLAPLRRIDVQKAAERWQAKGFVEEVISRRVVPFARKPLTLTALLSRFSQHKSLPPSQLEIYEEVCRVASSELSKSRREKLHLGKLTADERLQIAQRIAALSVFCNRGFICASLPFEPLADEDLGVDAVYGTERGGETEIRVDAYTLLETLDTGLFSWRSHDRVAWDHRTYSEFLAAQYCKRRNVSLRRLQKLIFAEAFDQRRVAPQLYETTAWLCLFYDGLVERVIKHDPTVLLLSDVLRENTAIRHKVTERYLRLFDEEKLFTDQLRDELERLAHPRLSEQLRPYLGGKNKKYAARVKAMDIAQACKLRDVEEDLVSVALDSDEERAIRTHALFVLSEYATSAARGRLIDLPLSPSADDPEEEIRGWALNAIWPEHITSESLFRVLTPPRRSNFIGGYISFLRRLSEELPSRLSERDLPVALRWVNSSDIEPHSYDHRRALADSILLAAWAHVDDADTFEELTEIIFKRIQQHAPIIEPKVHSQEKSRHPFHDLLDDDRKRRKLISALIARLAKDEKRRGVISLWFVPDQIIRTIDTEWLIEQIRVSADEEQKVIFDLLDAAPNDKFSLCAFNRALDAGDLPGKYRDRLYVDLASPLAAALIARHQEELSYQERPRELLQPPPSERIRGLLDKDEAGELVSWSWLTMTLTLDEYSRFYGDEGSDLRELVG